MRSLAVFLTVFSVLPAALVFPFVGVLLWAWVAFMNPHREAFGLAYDFPFNFYIAAATLLAWFVSAEPKRLPNQLLPVLLIAFAVLFSLSTYFAIDFDRSYALWDRHIKTIALAVVALGLMTSKLRIQAFLWVTVISIGYYAVKGAGYLLATGSASATIFGPSDSMIADNNNLSLAIVLIIPLLHYLRSTSANSAVKAACLIGILLAIVAVVGTYSRGGFIGLLVVGFAFLSMSRRKMAATLVAVVLGLGIWQLAPAAWLSRIDTIQTYQQDDSALSRIYAWQTSWNLAIERPLVGGGFAAIENPATYSHFRGPHDTTKDGRAAHSIYFQLLGDHGFPAFVVFLAMIGAAIFNLTRILKATRDQPHLAWSNLLARMLLVSIAGYVSAGSFLSMAYYDVFFCLLVMSVSLREVVASSGVEQHTEEVSPIETGNRPVPAFRARLS